MAAEFLYGLMNNRKSMKDFAREEEDFEAKKRIRNLAEREAEVKIKKSESEIGAFDTDKLKGLAARSIYEASQGLPLTPAGRAAIEAVGVMEGKKTEYKTINEEGDVRAFTADNPYSQYLSSLGGGTPPPERVSEYATPPFVESPTMGTGDPLLAHASAYDQQVANVGGSNPYARPITVADAERFIADQGTPMPAPAGGGQDLSGMASASMGDNYNRIRQLSGAGGQAGTKTDVATKQAAIDLAQKILEEENAGKVALETEKGKKLGEQAAKTEIADQKNSEALTQLNRAAELLSIAPGGYLGLAGSEYKKLANQSDAQSQADRQLKTISGWLVSNVPRMEGPQSNFDVENYNKMAADVSNTSIPTGDRIAAVEELIRLKNKYENNQGSAQSGGIKFLGFE
jgi:hypothetical protein